MRAGPEMALPSFFLISRKRVKDMIKKQKLKNGLFIEK